MSGYYYNHETHNTEHDCDEDLDDRYYAQGENPFDALAESYREYPRRTCPGGYDYAGHVCDADCRDAQMRAQGDGTGFGVTWGKPWEEADDDAVRAVQPDPGDAPEAA